MSTAERHPRPARDLARAESQTIVAILVSASLGAATALLLRGAHPLPIAPQLHGTGSEFASILARNASVCSALILSTHVRILRARWSRNAIDVLAALTAVPTAALVGAVAAQPGGVAYLPHAPLELLAIALSSGWWWRRATPSWPATAGRLAVVLMGLALAAGLETYATPHRRDRGSATAWSGEAGASAPGCHRRGSARLRPAQHLSDLRPQQAHPSGVEPGILAPLDAVEPSLRAQARRQPQPPPRHVS